MSYRKNYIRIYFWQSVSVLLGFASLFVVIPYISSNINLFGIFSVCCSLTILFTYGDLGFSSSCLKYAAEYYVKGQKYEELRIIGFTSFVMICVFALLSLGIIYIGFFPDLLIPSLVSGSESFYVARLLLFTLAASCPIIIGQRLLSIFFSIRVEDYKFQRLIIVCNIIRILSVFYFFGSGKYMIVEYYVFYQIVNVLAVFIALIYVQKYYKYKLYDLLLTVRFDKEIFNKIKKLTFTSVIMIISSALYYEIDLIVISKFFDIQTVSLYAAALSVLQLVRTFSAIVFSPYSSRYNHYVGLGDFYGLTVFLKKMITLFAPILIVPIVVLSITALPFVISWIGEQYQGAAILVSFLVLSFLFNFIKEPITFFLIAIEKNNILIPYSLMIPLVYWAGIFLFLDYLEIKSFAVMKFIAPIIYVIGSWILVSNEFGKKGYLFLKLPFIIKITFFPIVITIVVSLFFSQLMFEDYNRNALILNILLMSVSSIVSFFLSIPFNPEIKKELFRLIQLFYQKKRV